MLFHANPTMKRFKQIYNDKTDMKNKKRALQNVEAPFLVCMYFNYLLLFLIAKTGHILSITSLMKGVLNAFPRFKYA